MGSNVTNIALVLGLGALVGARQKFNIEITKTVGIFLLISVVPLVLLFDGVLNQTDALIFFAIYSFFLYRVISGRMPSQNSNDITKKEAAVQFLTLLAGIGVIMVSSGFVVENAASIAFSLGIFQSFLGATIIALSTTTPELAVDLTAIRNRKWGLAIGDILGSNITNLTLMLGINTAIRSFEPNLRMAYPIAAFILLTSLYLGYSILKNRELKKRDGMVLILLYAAYIATMSAIQVEALG